MKTALPLITIIEGRRGRYTLLKRGDGADWALQGRRRVELPLRKGGRRELSLSEEGDTDGTVDQKRRSRARGIIKNHRRRGKRQGSVLLGRSKE